MSYTDIGNNISRRYCCSSGQKSEWKKKPAHLHVRLFI